MFSLHQLPITIGADLHMWLLIPKLKVQQYNKNKKQLCSAQTDNTLSGVYTTKRRVHNTATCINKRLLLIETKLMN